MLAAAKHYQGASLMSLNFHNYQVGSFRFLGAALDWCRQQADVGDMRP